MSKPVSLALQYSHMKPNYKLMLLTMGMLFSFQLAVAQKINKELADRLAVIYRADQRYRVAAIAAAKKYGAGSPEDNELMKKQDAADLADLAEIEKILAIYGYPGKSMVGAQSHVAFTIVQHNDLEAQEKYLPLFTEAAQKGELDRALLPLMIDRVRTGKGQAQLYGTQLYEVPGSHKVQIQPIEDEVHVNVRRKAYGLPPLETYYKNWGIDYKDPTAAGNPNPKELYASTGSPSESRVEAIGGDGAILSRLRYPEKAKANRITGSVTVEYTIDKDGHTKNISVVKSLGYGCDEEAVRVIGETKYTNSTGQESELRMKLPFPYKKE